MDVSIVRLACLDALIETIVQSLSKTETRGGHQYELYIDKYRTLQLLGVERCPGKVHAFVEYLATKELVSKPDENVLNVVQTLSNGKKYLRVNIFWLQEFVTKSSSTLQDCCAGRVHFMVRKYYYVTLLSKLQIRYVKEYKCFFVTA